MKYLFEITEIDLKKLVLNHINLQLNMELELDQVHIEVKSKQNFRSEWEEAAFRARVEGNR